MLKTHYVASAGPTKDLLESGSGLIVASVANDGSPHASRGWGLDVLDANDMRLLVDADDAQLHENLAANGALAVTASRVTTLRSIQLKGRAGPMEVGSADDMLRMRRYCDEFFADVEATDGVSPLLMERIVPARLVAYRFEVDASFDQTPGPQAGSALPS